MVAPGEVSELTVSIFRILRRVENWFWREISVFVMWQNFIAANAVKSLSTSQTVTRVFPNRNENVQVFIRIENIFNWENAHQDHRFAVEFAGWVALRK